MERMKVAIYDEDVDYSQRLMHYLNRRFGDYMDVTAFSKKEHLLREVSAYQYDCVVSKDLADIGAISTIRICEDEAEDGYYRYGSAKALAEQIMQMNEPVTLPLASGRSLIGVYSVGDAEKRTAYAWQKAREQKGIYFGMEEYCSFDISQYDMEELLFLIRNRESNICSRIEESFLWQDGVPYLPSARCFLDYRYMSVEDYRWLFEKLTNEMDKNIIFDIGVGSFPGFEFFSLFDRIFLLTSDSKAGKQKEKIFLNLLMQEMPDLHDKIYFERADSLS